VSYDTAIRATSEMDWRLLFLKARQVVGIPDEWPFQVEDDTVDIWADSIPGGFDAAVHSYANHYVALPYDDEDEGPRPAIAEVRFVTDLGGMKDAPAQHARYARELGAWLDSLGVSYAVCDSRGDWSP
jgi:hypothetical protein